MLSKQELLLGKQAVALKYITREQLKQCIHLQEEQTLPLASIFLNQGLVAEEKLRTLLIKNLQRIDQTDSRDKGEDLVISRLLLREKAIAFEELFALVMRQKKAPENSCSLMELILKECNIPLAKFLQIYSNLQSETVCCSGCDKEFRLVNLAPGKKLRCRHCKSVFSVPSIEEDVAVFCGEQRVSIAAVQKQDVFAGYEILEQIAEGGMGLIYRAQRKTTGQIVALKVLREAHRTSREAKERFAREAHTLSRLKHPNIVAVLDVGIENEIPYFTMDYVEGQPLSDVIVDKRLPLNEIIRIVLKICEGLQYAHECGVIHRDIKPSNILIDKEEQPRITDFGLAKCMDSMTMVTRSGTMLGTPYYMSPEQARGQLGLVGPRSDIYALGVVLYEMLTGGNPFRGENTVEIYHNILTVAPAVPSTINTEISKPLDNICLKCLRKDPFQRYRNAGELAHDLRLFQQGRRPSWVTRLCRRLLGRA